MLAIDHLNEDQLRWGPGRAGSRKRLLRRGLWLGALLLTYHQGALPPHIFSQGRFGGTGAGREQVPLSPVCTLLMRKEKWAGSSPL